MSIYGFDDEWDDIYVDVELDAARSVAQLDNWKAWQGRCAQLIIDELRILNQRDADSVAQRQWSLTYSGRFLVDDIVAVRETVGDAVMRGALEEGSVPRAYFQIPSTEILNDFLAAIDDRRSFLDRVDALRRVGRMCRRQGLFGRPGYDFERLVDAKINQKRGRRARGGATALASSENHRLGAAVHGRHAGDAYD